MKCIRNVIQ